MAFTAPIEADYSLGLRVRLEPFQGGDIGVAVDGVAKPHIWEYNTYGELGGVHLTKGRHVITATTMDTPGDDDPFDIVVSGIDAIPLNNVTANSFAEAMNNDGISTDGAAFTADKALDLTGSSLSAQTMTAAGLAPGSAITVQGATFALPASNSAGNDNV